ISGARPEATFTEEAVELLARTTHGTPRLLNQAAHQAMLLAEQAASMPVDAEAALEALAGLGLALPEGEHSDESADDAMHADEEDLHREKRAEALANYGGQSPTPGRLSLIS